MQRNQESNKHLTRRNIIKYGLYTGLSSSLASSLCMSGCGTNRKRKRPNVLLISIDTVRKDHCSLYGYKKNTTPNLQKFAKQGTIFDLAYAPSSTTGPSHATFFTSLYPISHGVLKNSLKLSEGYKTIAEILQAHDYQTAAVVSSFVLDSKFGYAQGFEFYNDDFIPEESTVRTEHWEGGQLDSPFDRRADHTTNQTIKWLKKHRDPKQPFFLFVHYFDPHDPYTPPEPFRSLFAPKSSSPARLEKTVGRYDAEIALADKAVGDLLEQMELMNLSDDTLVVITSDHGEGLMQHNHLFHGVNIYEEAVRVPLLFRWPNRIPKARTLSAPIGLIDLTPTLLDLVGINPKDWPFQGHSLVKYILGRAKLEPDMPIYLYRRLFEEGIMGQTWVKGEKFGLRIGNFKYIEGREEGTKELFYLPADPNELANIYNFYPKKAAEISSKLHKWMQQFAATRAVGEGVSEQERNHLKSLGYVD